MELNDSQRKRSMRLFEKFQNHADEQDIPRIAQKVDSKKKGPIAAIWNKVLLLWALIKDPNAAWGTKATAIAALLYLISSIDAIPDFIPLAGLADDVMIIGVAIGMLTDTLRKYQQQKSQNKAE